MSLKDVLYRVLMSMLLAVLLVGCQAVADQGEKIPLTSSSPSALENFKQGRDLQEKLRFTESRQFLQNAVAEDPNFAMAHLLLAFSQPSAKEFFATLEQAVALADQASEAESMWILGSKAGVDGNPSKQREYYEKLAESFPKDERAQNLIGGHYFGQQMYEQAIAAYEKTIAIDPNYSPPYNQLGYAYRFLEQYDEAERAFKKYIELIPDDPNPYDSYAELLLKIGRYDESINNYQKALGVRSDFQNARSGIATNHVFKGDYAKARKVLQESYETAKDDGQRRAALFSMTVSYVHEGAWQKALENEQRRFEIAKKLSDSAAMAGDLGTQGNILLESGQHAQAKAKFEESLKIMQQSDLAAEQKDLAEHGHLFNLAHVALKQGDFAKAKNYASEYQKKAEARNNRFQVWTGHQLMGMIAYEQKNFDEAVAELGQSNLQNPYNIYRLGLAYQGKGDQNKGQEQLSKARNFNALNSLAQAFMKNRDQKMMSAK